MSNSPLRRSNMARVIEGSQFYLPPTRLFTYGMSHPAFSPRRSSLYFGRYSFSVPLRVVSWVGLNGWSQNRCGLPACRRVTRPSTNRARWRRRVTSLIETNSLPLSQTATYTKSHATLVSYGRVQSFVVILDRVRLGDLGHFRCLSGRVEWKKLDPDPTLTRSEMRISPSTLVPMFSPVRPLCLFAL